MTCGQCKFWQHTVDPSDHDVKTCGRLQQYEMNLPKKEMAGILYDLYYTPSIATRSNFGCVLFEQKGNDV